ncbi:MAG: sigma-70 family RNA polymerase sigma factor [Deltaproteobacteria bacterium]|nr:sigma-70 family RNA polymerase sigma factor [Deltaproteobacteria bacterium]
MLRHKPRSGEDPASFEAMTAPIVDRLYATALRLSRSEADAEDLVQETLLRGLEAMPRIDPRGNLSAYLHRVLVNVFINRYRHNQVVAHVNDLAGIGLLDGSLYSEDSLRVWSDPAVRFTHQNLSGRVAAALDAVPERFRMVLLLADAMDFSYAEVADALKIPVGTVMSRLFRARRMLRALLLEEAPAALRKAG